MSRRAGDRSGSAGAGDLHADPRFQARLRRVRREGNAALRGRLIDAGQELSLLAVFRDAPPRAGASSLEAWAARQSGAGRSSATSMRPAARWSRALGRDGWLKHTAPDPGARRRARRAHAVRSSARRWRGTDGLADFAFAMQGLGAGPISLFGSGEQRDSWLRKTRAGEAIAAFALDRSRLGLRRRQYRDDGRARRRRLRARRREDLDLERRHRRCLRRVRPHRRSARRARAVGLHRSRRHAGSDDRRAHRGRSRRIRWRGCASTSCRVPASMR